MSTINTLPKGLQELLGNTSQGKNPSNLLSDVRPTFDMLPFWTVDKLRFASVSANFVSVNNGAFLAVPQGEIWFPQWINGRITGLTAADVVRFNVGLLTPTGDRLTMASSPTYTATTVTDVFQIGHEFSRPMGVPGGWFFAAALEEISIAASPEVIQLTVAYLRTMA